MHAMHEYGSNQIGTLASEVQLPFNSNSSMTIEGVHDRRMKQKCRWASALPIKHPCSQRLKTRPRGKSCVDVGRRLKSVIKEGAVLLGTSIFPKSNFLIIEASTGLIGDGCFTGFIIVFLQLPNDMFYPPNGLSKRTLARLFALHFPGTPA
jgi:hypothetical protein